MKFFLLVLFSLSVKAYSSTEVHTAMAELDYALTVEWDQQDRDFYEVQVEKFHKVINEQKESGLTDQQVFQLALSNVKDQKLAQELYLGLKMGHYDLNEVFAKTHQQGASWNGKTVGFIAVGVAIFVVWQVYRAYEYQKENWGYNN